MSMPDTDMSDSWEAARRTCGYIWAVDDVKSFASTSSGEASDVESGDMSVSSFSSGMADCGSGSKLKLSLTNEFAGLGADTTANAGLLLAVSEIGVLELRMVARLGGLRLDDFRRRCFGTVSRSKLYSFDLTGPNIGDDISIESGGLVGRDES